MGRSRRKDPIPVAPLQSSPLEGLGSRLAGSGAPQVTQPRQGRRAAAALAVLLLALLFVLPLGRESGMGVATPSPSPSGEASVEPSAEPSASPVLTPTPTATPTPPSPSPTVAPSESPTTAPTGSPIVIGTCSRDVRIALASEWADSRFIVRTISVALPTTDCDGASAQVLLLDADGGLLLRRDGIIATQELIFNVMTEEIPSQTVQGTAIEITAPTTIPGSSPSTSPEPSSGTGSLSLEIVGRLGSLIEEVEAGVIGEGLAARSRLQLRIASREYASSVGDDGRGAIRQGVDERAPGAFVITAIGETATGPVQRRAYIALDEVGRVVILIRDYDAWLLANGANAVPELPVGGRGATILTAEDGRVVYLDERVSVNAWAAQLGNAATTLTRPSTLLGGILTGVLVALLGLAAGLVIDLIKRKVRQYFEGALERFRLPDLGSHFPNLLGFRIDVLPFLLVGQVIAALNAPLEKFPPLMQLVQGAALGALGILLVSEFTRIPRTQYMRRTLGDAGVFHGRWTSILLALIALGLSHFLNIVPGILVGLFAARRFRLELGDAEDAEVTWRTSLLQAAAAVAAWFAIDLITTQFPDPESALRAISDGILSTIVVIGSHGLLASMVNPTDSGSVALRRAAPIRWISLIGVSGILVVGIISTGGSAEELFGAGVSLQQLAALALLSVAIIIAALFITRMRSEATNVR